MTLVRLSISLMLFAAITTQAYAADLPSLDVGSCQDDQGCIDHIKDGAYMALVISWKNFKDEDKLFCLNNEEYAQHYPKYYDMLNECLAAKSYPQSSTP